MKVILTGSKRSPLLLESKTGEQYTLSLREARDLQYQLGNGILLAMRLADGESVYLRPEGL